MNAAAAETADGGGALRDLVVVEFGRYAAGPLLGMLLGDQGAQVIKVEEPGGDPARSEPAFAIWNRGKKSITVDLKSSLGLSTAESLIRAADIVIENFRPGVADRLGIGFERATALNPYLIYCSLPGYPPESPRRMEAGWDSTVGAATGTFQRGPQSTSLGIEATPLYTPLLLPSTFAALVAAGAISAALISRLQTGMGQRVEVPLYSATFAATGMFLVKIRDNEKAWTRWEKLPLPEAYQCADGRWIQAYGNNRRQLAAMFDAFGRPEWTDAAVAIIEEAPNRDVVDLWRARFTETFRSRDAAAWESEISAAGGVCVMCRTIEEFFALDHARQAELIVDVQDRTWGPMTQPGIAVVLRRTPGAVRKDAPLLGEHTSEVLQLPAHTGTSPKRLPVVAPSQSPLAGIRVLDLSILLAGPSCGRVLAEYGADVIKIDDPKAGRRSDSRRTRLMWLDVNRGKRSVLLDLATEDGQAVFWRLVDTADVIVENFRAGRWDAASRKTVGPTKLEKLGLGYEDIRTRRPEIIYLSISAFGRYGEFTERGGYEQAGQAMAGIMVRHGGRSSRALALAYPYNDYGTGLVAAYGVLLAVFERFKTGRGQRLDASLAATACLLQSRYMFDMPGNTRNELEGPSLLGESWISRLYRASDGWFMLHGGEPEAWDKLRQIEQFSVLTTDPRFGTTEQRARLEGELAGILSEGFAAGTRDYWLSTLRAAGLSAAEHLSITDLTQDETAREAGLIVGRPHDGFGWVDHGGPIPRLSSTPALVGRPSPFDGADTADVLTSIGFSASEIEGFRARGVVG